MKALLSLHPQDSGTKNCWCQGKTEKEGVEVTTAGLCMKESKGMLGAKVMPDILLKDAK